MATKIQTLNNKSDQPSAYLGTGSATPTGWAAWGFPASAAKDFGWTVETARGNQVLLTKAGVFQVWDDSNWNIFYCDQNSQKAMLLVKLNSLFPGVDPVIELTVEANGHPTARQI